MFRFFLRRSLSRQATALSFASEYTEMLTATRVFRLGPASRQKSGGGKQRLGRIARQGDDYLRPLFLQDAR
jgi:hypothetical protein